MSDRIVRHSSRYQGPMGDSRSPKEIFAGIEARAKQSQEFREKMTAIMDEIMENATLMSWESRADLIRETAIDWLYENHPDFQDRKQNLNT